MDAQSATQQNTKSTSVVPTSVESSPVKDTGKSGKNPFAGKKIPSQAAAGGGVKPTDTPSQNGPSGVLKGRAAAGGGNASDSTSSRNGPSGVLVESGIADLLARASALGTLNVHARPSPSTYAAAAAPAPQSEESIRIRSDLENADKVRIENETKTKKERMDKEKLAAQLKAKELRDAIYTQAYAIWQQEHAKIKEALLTARSHFEMNSAILTPEVQAQANANPDLEASKEAIRIFIEITTLLRSLEKVEKAHRDTMPLTHEQDQKKIEETEQKMMKEIKVTEEKKKEAEKAKFNKDLESFIDPKSTGQHSGFQNVCSKLADGAVKFEYCLKHDIDPLSLENIRGKDAVLFRVDEESKTVSLVKEWKNNFFAFNPNVAKGMSPEQSVEKERQYYKLCIMRVCFTFWETVVKRVSENLKQKHCQVVGNSAYLTRNLSNKDRETAIEKRKNELLQLQPSNTKKASSVPKASSAVLSANAFGDLGEIVDVIPSLVAEIPQRHSRETHLEIRGGSVCGSRGGCLAAGGGVRHNHKNPMNPLAVAVSEIAPLAVAVSEIAPMTDDSSTEFSKKSLRELCVLVGKNTGGIPVDTVGFTNPIAWGPKGLRDAIIANLKLAKFSYDSQENILSSLVKQGLIQNEDTSIPSAKRTKLVRQCLNTDGNVVEREQKPKPVFVPTEARDSLVQEPISTVFSREITTSVVISSDENVLACVKASDAN